MSVVENEIVLTSAKARLEEHLRFVVGYRKAVNATQTFEEILGEALPTKVCLVLVHSLDDQVLTINPVGEADVDEAGIGNGDWFPCYGDKAALDLYELWTGQASKYYQFFVYTRLAGAE